MLYIGALLLQKSAAPSGWGFGVTASIVGLAIYSYLVRGFFQLAEKRRRYRLGLGGERAVGEELNRLMLDGAQVFHDVPCLYGNVDHVLVAPCGVYAIETKTRRKKPVADERTQRVVYDGRTVRFGVEAREETKCLEQASRQASQLSDWLSKAVGSGCPGVAGLVRGPAGARGGTSRQRSRGSPADRRRAGARACDGPTHRPPI